MYIKQWAAALLLGAIVLGTASCAKDEPKKPETSIAIEDLAGTWNLSGATVSPETRRGTPLTGPSLCTEIFLIQRREKWYSRARKSSLP